MRLAGRLCPCMLFAGPVQADGMVNAQAAYSSLAVVVVMEVCLMSKGWGPAGHTRLARRQCPAGLLGGERFHGRVNPQLGHGQPPPEQYDETRTLAEHHKAWHPQHSHLLQKRCALGVPPACCLLLQHQPPAAGELCARGLGCSLTAVAATAVQGNLPQQRVCRMSGNGGRHCSHLPGTCRTGAAAAWVCCQSEDC